jgi:hypothetical protein
MLPTDLDSKHALFSFEHFSPDSEKKCPLGLIPFVAMNTSNEGYGEQKLQPYLKND